MITSLVQQHLFHPNLGRTCVIVCAKITELNIFVGSAYYEKFSTQNFFLRFTVLQVLLLIMLLWLPCNS